MLYERFAIEVLRACASVSAAAELLGLSWDQLHLIMERAVERGMERRELEELRHVGMDEKSFAKGQSYVSLLTDLDEGRVLEVMEGNDREAADMLFATLPEEVLKAIEAVAIDMSGHFAAAAREALPEAALVHDRFHISAHLNDGSPIHRPPLFPSASSAVAEVHREENRRLQKLGDERLKGTQRLFGFDPDHLGEEAAVRFAELKGSDLKSARAWAIKEVFRRFWLYSYEGSARKFLMSDSGFLDGAVKSRSTPRAPFTSTPSNAPPTECTSNCLHCAIDVSQSLGSPPSPARPNGWNTAKTSPKTSGPSSSITSLAPARCGQSSTPSAPRSPTASTASWWSSDKERRVSDRRPNHPSR